MAKKTRMYFATDEELERFDQILTALGQAFWALMNQRSVCIEVESKNKKKITKEEEKFYQLHLDLNSKIDIEKPI